MDAKERRDWIERTLNQHIFNGWDEFDRCVELIASKWERELEGMDDEPGDVATEPVVPSDLLFPDGPLAELQDEQVQQLRLQSQKEMKRANDCSCACHQRSMRGGVYHPYACCAEPDKIVRL